ncbi:MAG: hypothetical protein FRX49_03508 [Trebouxia sp. A1-2]|nr:MAG: hypothetical protein FRX49_03508 [Trebouxia sp. A1-2]
MDNLHFQSSHGQCSQNQLPAKLQGGGQTCSRRSNSGRSRPRRGVFQIRFALQLHSSTKGRHWTAAKAFCHAGKQEAPLGAGGSPRLQPLFQDGTYPAALLQAGLADAQHCCQEPQEALTGHRLFIEHAIVLLMLCWLTYSAQSSSAALEDATDG